MVAVRMPHFAAELLTDLCCAFRESLMDRAEPRSLEMVCRSTLLSFLRRVLEPAVEEA